MTPRANSLARNDPEEGGTQLQDTALSHARRLAIATRSSDKQPQANVLGVQVEALEMAAAVKRIETALKAHQKGYVCMAGVHGIMEAQRKPEVKSAFADAFMTLPDGTPMAWVGKLQGLRWMERLTGPDLMLEIFQRKELAEFGHFLYGGKPGVAEELAAILSRRFPWARIVGTFTPPFRDLTLAEEQQLISTVRKARPSIIWVGISTPRQEMFMQKYLPLLDTSLMFGVGAAFDFHTGRIRDCAEWIKRAGLQWLHRLIQDPRHLLWRYLRNNPEFVWRIAMQLAGVRTYATYDSPRDFSKEGHPPCESGCDLCTGDSFR